MKDCTQLVSLLKDTVPDVPRDFSNLVVNAVANATSAVSSAIRNYGSVYGQNQMLEYSTDGKISDVTSSFGGRTAISDSVLANLKNELTTLKSNYDKAWSLLPVQTDTVPITVTEELSASFSVDTSTSGPQAQYHVEWNEVRENDLVLQVRNQQQDVILDISAQIAPNGQSFGISSFNELMTLADLIRRLPGTLVFNDASGNLTSFTVISAPNITSTSLIIMCVGNWVNIAVTYFSRYAQFNNISGDTSLDTSFNITSSSYHDDSINIGIQIPGVLVDATILVDGEGVLSYSVPQGQSTIVATKEVTTTVDYEYSYNVLPNESHKIQSLIEAIP